MLSYPLNRLIHLRKNTTDGILAIYVNTALRTLALSLIGIFLPVFIFLQTQEFLGNKTIAAGLLGVVFYFFIYRLVDVVFLIPASKMLAKWGFRWSILVSNIMLGILLFLLSIGSQYYWAIIIASVAHGIQGAIYWLSYRSLFAKDGVVSHLGKEVGTSVIFGQVVAIAGPVIGGVIITIWGFSALYIVALVVAFASSIPFFFMKRHERNKAATLRSVINWLRKKENRNEEISYIGRHVDNFIYAIFWPIFVFLILGSFEKQGLAASLGLISSTLFVYLAGRMFDKKHSLKVYKFGIFASALIGIAKGFVKSLGHLVFYEVSYNTVSPFYWVTFDTLIYERAKEDKKEVLTFMVARMFMVSLALFLVLIFVLVVAFYPWRFWAMWILGSLGILVSVFLWEKKDDRQ